MTNEEAIKYLQQLCPNGGHCWLDEQRIEAISMAVKALQEEPVSDGLEEAMQHNAPDNIGIDDLLYWRNGFITGAKWQKIKDESTTEDLGEYINELSKQFPEVSFAKLSRIAVRVAKWQKEHICKPADGRELPEIDRDVICLLDCGKVIKAHRPQKKDNLCVPETYGKGGWSYPNIEYWLDVKLPKEI